MILPGEGNAKGRAADLEQRVAGLERPRARQALRDLAFPGVRDDDAVVGPTGRQGTYLRWEWKGAGAVIVPTDGQRLYLWPMYRYPIGCESLEFPRGAAEPDESVTDAAARELAEETGFAATRTVILGRVHADSGLIATSNTVVLAYIDAARPGQSRLEAYEAIAGPATALTTRQLSGYVRNGDITCALTIAAFVHALPYIGDPA